jgi:hypothetical protein
LASGFWQLLREEVCLASLLSCPAFAAASPTFDQFRDRP